MKNKIGFMALAIITVLATLGVGFSMWSQTVTVNGTVGTGNVTLQVSNYSATIAYKDANSVLQFSEATQIAWPPAIPSGALWGPAFAEVDLVNGVTPTGPVSCTGTGITMHLLYQNLFPVPNPAAANTFKPWCADFDITNTGSLPIKLEVSPVSTSVTSPVGAAAPPVTVVYTQGGSVFNAEGKQLEPGDSVHVEICIAVNEQTVQSYNGSFSLLISGVQWNEYRVANPIEVTVPRTSPGLDLGFELGTDGWVASTAINRVANGAGVLNLPGDAGGFYGEIHNLDGAYTDGVGYGTGGYSFYGGKGLTYLGDFFQTIDVYVNPAWLPVNGSFWIDMTPAHLDSNNYGAEHNFHLIGTGTSVKVTVDGDTNLIDTITTAGWYSFVMTWSKGALATDLVTSTLKVYQAGTLTQLGTTATVVSNSPGGPFLSSDLLGNGYVWITVWQNGFANDVIGVDKLNYGLLPYAP